MFIVVTIATVDLAMLDVSSSTANHNKVLPYTGKKLTVSILQCVSVSAKFLWDNISTHNLKI